MPFRPPFSRPFTAMEVRSRVPAASGIYGISNAAEWIYIGESADLQSTLLGILDRPNPTFPQRKPTGFTFELCGFASRPARQGRLVTEYRPICNSFGDPPGLDDIQEARHR